MKRDNINALNAPQPRGGYSQAVSIEDFRRVLFVSGQIPVTSDDVVPEGFEAQARQVWLNVDAQLKAAGMSKTDIVKARPISPTGSTSWRTVSPQRLSRLVGSGNDGGDHRHFRFGLAHGSRSGRGAIDRKIGVCFRSS